MLAAAADKSPALAQAAQTLKTASQAAASRRINLDDVSARAVALADTHLGRGVEPLFAARLKVYESIASLAESADEPVPALTIGEGSALFAEVNAAAEAARVSVRSLPRAADQPAGDVDPRVKGCLAAIDSAASARRATIVAAYTIPTLDEQTLRAAAARLSDELGAPPDAGSASLPLARTTAAPEAAFDPRASGTVIAEVLTAAKSAPPSSALARSGPAATSGFIRASAAAWTDGLALRISPSDQLTWDKFQQGLASAGRAASIRESLAAEARHQTAAAESLSAATAGAPIPAEARQAVDRLTRLATASTAAAANPALDAAYDRVLSNWKALGSDAAEARRRLLAALATPAGVQDYLVTSLADPRETDLVASWWRSFSLAGLRTLSRDAGRASPAAGGNRLARFPLAKYDAAAGQLTPAEVLEVRAASSGSPAAGTPIADSIRDPDLAAEVRALAQSSGGTTAGLNAAMLAILPERADQRFACNVELQPDAAGPAFAAIRIRQLGAETRTVAATAGAATNLGRIDYPGASVQIEFLASDTPEAQPIATASIPGPWLGLWLIAAQSGKPVVAADRRLWEAQLPVETAAGPRTMRLHLRFDDRELPDPAQWPR